MKDLLSRYYSDAVDGFGPYSGTEKQLTSRERSTETLGALTGTLLRGIGSIVTIPSQFMMAATKPMRNAVFHILDRR